MASTPRSPGGDFAPSPRPGVAGPGANAMGGDGDDAAWLAGASPAIEAFRRDLARLSASDVSVLLEGESGSGKNLAARALHRASARSSGPLVEVDLSSLTPTLIEAELFGHEAGAFTGAHARRVGRFQRAEGGTIVLDGVERLPEALQGKLLRVLQERVVEPLGAERASPVDVRVVATSGTDLHERVRARRFREDLFYRLAVVRFRVPALRERAADLPEIVHGLVRRIATRARVAPRPVSHDAWARLRAHAWPGNLRELENALERVLVLGDSSASGAAAASAANSNSHTGPNASSTSSSSREVRPEEFDFLSESVAGADARLAREALAHGITWPRIEAALLDEAMRESRGNLTAAARLLGITRRSFEVRYGRRQRADESAGEGADDSAPRGDEVGGDDTSGPDHGGART